MNPRDVLLAIDPPIVCTLDNTGGVYSGPRKLSTVVARLGWEAAELIEDVAAMLARVPDTVSPAGDPRFVALIDQIGRLHAVKQADYGRDEDPYANVRASEDFGIPGWVGSLTRANDKIRRLQKAARGGTMANESVEDSFLDLAVYALIGLILYRESVGGEEGA